uniref:Uncharacterized protein n=1 Tax=Globodera rostochiensis TaxID=31243 RepID=A0A914I8F2_GLORO
MFALTVFPTLFVVLLVYCLREPARTVHVLSVLLPFVPSHSSPFFVLLPAHFVLLCSVLCLLSWQLHTLRRCQEQFQLGWDSPNVKGYAELYVPDPFLRCEKQSLKHQQRKKEAQKVAADEKALSNSARVTLKKVLPDYQVFTLNEDEPNVKQQDGGIEGESQQQKRQEYGKNSRSRAIG